MSEAPQETRAFENDITFDVKFRGYHRQQVEDYIDALTVDYNSICEKCDDLERENDGLRRALARLNEVEGRAYEDD